VLIVSGGGFAVGAAVGVAVGTVPVPPVPVATGPVPAVGTPFGGPPLPFAFPPPVFTALPASSPPASSKAAAPASSSPFSCPGSLGFHASVEWHSPHVVGNFPACPGAFAYSASWHAKHSGFVPANTGDSPLWQSKQRVAACFPVRAHHSWSTHVGFQALCPWQTPHAVGFSPT
jgi:hypothetical protein